MHDPHARLMNLMADLTRRYMEIGSLLAHIQEYEVWKNKRFKCKTFRDYLWKYPELSYGTASRWMQIARTFGPLKYPKSLVLGPTKMYLLCPLVDQGNVRQMLGWARRKTSADILRRRNARRNRTVSFWVTDEEHDRIETYINEAILAGTEENGKVVKPTKGDAAVLLFDTAMHQMAG